MCRSASYAKESFWRRAGFFINLAIYSCTKGEQMDFYKFWQILEGTNENRWNMEPENRADFENHYGSRGDDAPDTSIHGDKEIDLKLVYSNGVFKDQDTGKLIHMPLDARLKSIIGEPNDVYSLRGRIIVSGNISMREPYEIDDNSVEFEVDGCDLYNDRTDQGFEVPNPESLFHLVVLLTKLTRLMKFFGIRTEPTISL